MKQFLHKLSFKRLIIREKTIKKKALNKIKRTLNLREYFKKRRLISFHWKRSVKMIERTIKLREKIQQMIDNLINTEHSKSSFVYH